MWSLNNAGSWDGYNCWDDVDLQESGVGTYNCPKWSGAEVGLGVDAYLLTTVGMILTWKVGVPKGISTPAGSWDVLAWKL